MNEHVEGSVRPINKICNVIIVHVPFNACSPWIYMSINYYANLFRVLLDSNNGV